MAGGAAAIQTRDAAASTADREGGSAANTGNLTAAGDLNKYGAQAQLHFRFSGDCWVEVRNAADELIYADLRREGDVLNLSGLAPFNVLLGDARVVELAYLGEAVGIKRRPGRLTARFSVGQE